MLCHRRRHASRKGQEMSDYTPEPWRVDARTGCYAIYQASENHNCLSGMDKQAIVYQSGRGEESQPNGYRYLTEEQLANARRIVACVNACAGIADPAAEIARLRADNDEIDEVCTRRQLKIYELEAEIAKLRAEREEHDARIRFEARAEALREARKKIQALSDNLGSGDVMMTDKDRAMEDAFDLVFEILADEPKEERQGCFRCRNRPQPGGDRQLCDSCRLIVGQNYDPAPLADEPKEE